VCAERLNFTSRTWTTPLVAEAECGQAAVMISLALESSAVDSICGLQLWVWCNLNYVRALAATRVRI